MKSKLITGICAAFILLSSVSATADSTLHIWQCELKDGKSGPDAAAAASKWLAAVKAVGAGEDAEVSIEFAMASSLSERAFNFVLSVADTKAWGEFWANAAGPELAAANEAFRAVASCDAGSIWNSFDIE